MSGTVTAIGVCRLKRLAFLLAMYASWMATCVAAESYQPVFSDSPAQNLAKEYVFAVYPLHNTERLYASYGPLIEYLSEYVPDVRFRLEASRSYEDFERKIAARSVHFVLCNPRQILIAIKNGYRVIGKMTDDADHYGIILIPTGSSIEKITDLKGKKISFPAPTAFAGTMLPQFFLHNLGIDVHRDIEAVYVGSQESSILSVYHGLTAAGATWMGPWRKFAGENPEIAGKLVVKWQTDPLPNNGIAVLEDVPLGIRTKVGAVLFRLQNDDAGRAALKAIPVSKFEPADAEAYVSTQNFVERFNAQVRPVTE